MWKDSLYSQVSFFYNINECVDSTSLSKRSLHLWHSFGNLSINIKTRVNVVLLCGLLFKTFSKCQAIVILLATQCGRKLGIIFIFLQQWINRWWCFSQDKLKHEKLNQGSQDISGYLWCWKSISLSKSIYSCMQQAQSNYYLNIKCATEIIIELTKSFRSLMPDSSLSSNLKIFEANLHRIKSFSFVCSYAMRVEGCKPLTHFP